MAKKAILPGFGARITQTLSQKSRFGHKLNVFFKDTPEFHGLKLAKTMCYMGKMTKKRQFLMSQKDTYGKNDDFIFLM